MDIEVDYRDWTSNKNRFPFCCLTLWHSSNNSWNNSKTKGTFHLTKNPGLNFRNFRMLNGTVFSTRPNRSWSIPAWAHFPPRIARENAAGSWWSGCLKCRIKLLRVEKFKKHSEFNSSWYLWEKLTNFSRERVCKPGELTHRKFRRNDQSTIFQAIRS